MRQDIVLFLFSSPILNQQFWGELLTKSGVSEIANDCWQEWIEAGGFELADIMWRASHPGAQPCVHFPADRHPACSSKVWISYSKHLDLHPACSSKGGWARAAWGGLQCHCRLWGRWGDWIYFDDIFMKFNISIKFVIFMKYTIFIQFVIFIIIVISGVLLWAQTSQGEWLLPLDCALQHGDEVPLQELNKIEERI